MTASAHYFAPFGPRGTHPIDEDLATRLLGIALGRSGDYADLFFEYRAGGGLTFEEGITRSASRGVSLGVGVRVRQGDATGRKSMTFDQMKDMLEKAGRDVTEADLDELGDFVVDETAARRFIIARDLDHTTKLLHRRADAIGQRAVPPHHGMPV